MKEEKKEGGEERRRGRSSSTLALRAFQSQLSVFASPPLTRDRRKAFSNCEWLENGNSVKLTSQRGRLANTSFNGFMTFLQKTQTWLWSVKALLMYMFQAFLKGIISIFEILSIENPVNMLICTWYVLQGIVFSIINREPFCSSIWNLRLHVCSIYACHLICVCSILKPANHIDVLCHLEAAAG